MAEGNGRDGSTIPHDDSGAHGWERPIRYISLAWIAALVAAGLLGLLGVRTDVASASAGGMSLSVDHASITRPGLATPFAMTIASTDGSPLPGEVTTRVGSDYMAMFDENGLDPDPTSSFQDGEWTHWTFAVPDGASRLVVSFDGRLEPAVQWGRSTTAAVDVDGETRVTVDFDTWVLP